MTPATLYYGQARQIQRERPSVLAAAYAAHPERFVRGLPTPPALPEAVWVNKSKTQAVAQEILP